MNGITFAKATRKAIKLRMALDGPSGSGKTYTGLIAATALAAGGRVAVIDTEHGSASKYADRFDFDVVELPNFNPTNYIAAIKTAEECGYAVVLIDSLSHAWEGEGGVLELHDQATAREPGRNSFTAWRNVTPLHQQLIEAMLTSKCDVIATMRTKTDYIQKDEDGRKSIVKVALAPVQRAGMEYEFDVVADMDVNHKMIVSKSRCFEIADAVVEKPKAEWFLKLRRWLDAGAQPAPQQPAGPVAQAPATNGNGHEQQSPAVSQPPAQGWATWSDKAHAAFWAKANKVNLSKDVLHEEFGVTSMTEFCYGMNEAAKILDVLDYGTSKVLIGLLGIKAAMHVRYMYEIIGTGKSAADYYAVIDAWAKEQEAQGQKIARQEALV
jgi:hypothetical protein